MPQNIPIEVVIRALNLTQPEIEKIKRDLEQFKQSQRAALGQHREDIERARGAAELLGQQFGVTIPRELRKVLAESQFIGPALSAAFSVAAVTGFIFVIGSAIDKLEELTAEAVGFGKKAKEAFKRETDAEKQYQDKSRQAKEIEFNASLKGLDEDEAAKKRLEHSEQVKKNIQEGIDKIRQWNQSDAALVSDYTEKVKALKDESRKLADVFDFAGSSGGKKQELEDRKRAIQEQIDAYEKSIKVLEERSGPTGDHALKLRELNGELLVANAKIKEASADAHETAAEAAKRHAEELKKAAAEAAKLASTIIGIGEKAHTSGLNAYEKQLKELDDAEHTLLDTLKQHPEAQQMVIDALEKVQIARVDLVANANRKILESMKLTDAQIKDDLTKLMAGLNEQKLDAVTGKNPTVTNVLSGLPHQDENAGLISHEKLDEITPQMQKIKKISEEIGGEFSNIFAELVDGTHSVSDAFANMAKSVAASIMAMVAKMLIMAAVERLIGYAVGAFMGGRGFNLNGTAVTPHGFDSSGAFVVSGARAGGGPVMANMPYLIGERGPELFVPGSSGTVVPNGKFGGAPNFQMVVHNETGSPIDQSNTATRFDGEKFVVDVFLKQMATNGPLRQALGRR